VIAKLKQLQPSAPCSPKDRYLQALESELAVAVGQPETARRLAEAVVASPRRLADCEMNTEFASAAFHDTLARLALGRPLDAADVFARIVDGALESVSMPIIYVHALYALGRIELEFGDTARGRALLERVLEHWGRPSGNWLRSGTPAACWPPPVAPGVPRGSRK
jgi:Tetratricopeptide repeat